MSVILLCLSLVTYIGILRCPRNLSHHMDRQASNGDTVLVKSREMTGRAQTLPWWLEGERVKTTENKMHWSRCWTVSSFDHNFYFSVTYTLDIGENMQTISCAWGLDKPIWKDAKLNVFVFLDPSCYKVRSHRYMHDGLESGDILSVYFKVISQRISCNFFYFNINRKYDIKILV